MDYEQDYSKLAMSDRQWCDINKAHAAVSVKISDSDVEKSVKDSRIIKSAVILDNEDFK